jgi:hypothetical protein
MTNLNRPVVPSPASEWETTGFHQQRSDCLIKTAGVNDDDDKTTNQQEFRLFKMLAPCSRDRQ